MSRGKPNTATATAEPKPLVRTSKYTPALADEICERLANGESLIGICRDEHMPSEFAVRSWVINDREGFASKYASARDIGLEHEADQIMEIADDKSEDPKSRQIRVDARKWRLSKLAPKRYGERLELAGDKDAPLCITVKRLDK